MLYLEYPNLGHGEALHRTTIKRAFNDPSEFVAVCVCGAVMVAHSEEAAERAGHNHEINPTVFASMATAEWSGCCC